MKQLSLIIFIVMSLHQITFAQSNDTWLMFTAKNGLKGYKDKTGKVRIEPKFGVFTSANKFEDIIGASEEKAGKLKDYYLTKKGRVVGRDSLFVLDYSAACESEGYILFRNRKTNKVGMLNNDGDVAIPAEYNFLTSVRNGLVVARVGAQWDESKRDEHFPYPWIGGKILLIDVHQKVLVKDFSGDEEIDFFSIKVSDQPDQDTVRQNFKGVNGKYYSFINFQKEFKAWLKTSLLINFTKSSLLNASYRNVFVWKTDVSKSGSLPKELFIKNYFDVVKTKLAELNSAKCRYSISNDEGLNSSIYETPEFDKYFDNCGNSKNWIYPVREIIINHNFSKKDFSEDHFEFLRTDDGYKLISVSIGTK